MCRATIVIPNYNGLSYIAACLTTLRNQDASDIEIIVVDNASTDGSRELVIRDFPEVRLIPMEENTGFSKAVNVGIKAASAPYVILLNNDTEVDRAFVNCLVNAIAKDERLFSVAAKMISLQEKDKIDDAGDFYTVLGWAFARGKGANVTKYEKAGAVFSACAGAAVYRREIFDEIGYFDEAHFAYLEDLDIGYRARIYGYRNGYEPSAIVYHAGSAASGARYNAFKIELAAQNSVYVLAKNLCLLQWILHFPMILCGFFIKWIFFTAKGYGKNFSLGLKRGIILSKQKESREKKVRFRLRNTIHYLRIEWELWVNLFRLLFYR